MYSTPELRYNWVDGSRNFPTEWYWNDGKLTNNASKDQFLYLHFLKWKRDWDNITPLDEVLKDELDSSWKITAKGLKVSNSKPNVLHLCHDYQPPFLSVAQQYGLIFKDSPYNLITVYLKGEETEQVIQESFAHEVIFLKNSSKELIGS